MKVTQISVFLENKSGRLSSVTRILGESGINIRALSIADTTDFGILRIIVDRPKLACETLENKGFMVQKANVLAVELPDRPGGLAGILKTLSEKGINIEYLYAFIGHPGEEAVVIFKVEQLERAVEVLTAADIRLIPGSELYSY